MGIPWRRALWPMAAALLVALAWASTATAAPLVVPAPGGAQITIDKHAYLAGERITITGTGFTATTGGTGNPVIAVKVNDADDFPTGWTWGGPSEFRGGGGGPGDEEYAAFEIVGGAFSGWIDVSATQAPWDTWLRFLGGSLSTGDNRLQPMSEKGNIRIAGPTATATVVGAAHPGGDVTVSLRDFMRDGDVGGQKVALKIDGAGAVVACIQTNAYGGADQAVTLPADIALGDHAFTVLAGSACVPGGSEPPARSITAPFTVTLPPATAAITGGNLVPGGTIDVTLAKFARNDGLGGQKVAFKIDRAGDVLACIQTDATGAGSGSIPLPAGITAGDHELNILAGSACGEGSQMPGRSIALPFTVTVPAAPPAPAPAPAPIIAPPPAGNTGPAPVPTIKKKVKAPALRVVTLVNKGKRVRITLRKATPARTGIKITTAAKVRLKPKTKKVYVTLATGVVKAKGKVATLKLTAKGKRYLATRAKGAKVRVKVVRAPKRGVRASQKMVLRVKR